MKPNILCGFIWIQIVCKGHQRSSKFTSSELRVKEILQTMIMLTARIVVYSSLHPLTFLGVKSACVLQYVTFRVQQNHTAILCTSLSPWKHNNVIYSKPSVPAYCHGNNCTSLSSWKHHNVIYIKPSVPAYRHGNTTMSHTLNPLYQPIAMETQQCHIH